MIALPVATGRCISEGNPMMFAVDVWKLSLLVEWSPGRSCYVRINNRDWFFGEVG
jgi:hypothetical protein